MPNTPTKQPSPSATKAQKARSGSGASVFASNASQSPHGAGTGLKRQNVALLSDSPSHSLALNNQPEDGDGSGPFSVWDGDDMTLEMVTDINEGDVDEDVSLTLRGKTKTLNQR
jgi:pyrimidine and pyridine-specific 5'-nucleotidase